MLLTTRRSRYYKEKRPIDTPPLQFPVVIKPHVYNESGLSSCLTCGQKSGHRLHIKRHYFEVNLNSTLSKCMCGYAKSHSIHLVIS